MSETVRLLPAVVVGDALTRSLHHAFLDQSGAGTRYHATRSQALLGAMYLSQDRPALLRKTAWLDAARIIEEELVRVFYASRSILKRSSDGGIEAILRPQITAAMQGRGTGSTCSIGGWKRMEATQNRTASQRCEHRYPVPWRIV